MNPRITATAERARTRIITHRPVRPHPTPATIPLPVLAAIWRWAPPTAPGIFGWPTWRWPLNGPRSLTARAWPRCWTGHRHPATNLVVRAVFTVTFTGLAAAALALAVVVTAVAVGVWVAGHVVGVVLILAGWSPPPSRRHLEHELATLTTAGAAPSSDSPSAARPTTSNENSAGDPWDFNARNDPWLTLERARLEELRRYNNLLEADTTRPAAVHGSPALPAPKHRPAVTYRARQPRGWRAVRALALVSVLTGLVWFAATALLSVAATVGAAPEPPSFEQIHASINQPTSPSTVSGTATSGTGS